MSSVIIVSKCRAQGRYGYQLSVIKNGDEVFFQDRLGEDPGEAAAQALMYKARYAADRVIADSNVMRIVNGTN